MLVSRALASVARTGQFFELAAAADISDSRPAAELYLDGLAALIAATGTRLRTGEARVAAATVHLAVAARLWSPVLGCGLGYAIVPDLAELRIGTSLPLRMSIPEPRGWQVTGLRDLADLAYLVVVTAHLGPLGEHFPVKVAPGLLRGNVASAMTSALRVLCANDPGLVRRARPLARWLLGTGLLRGTGDLTGPGLEFRRRSCCLYYRVPGGGICADCPFPGRPGSYRQAGS